MKTKHVKLLFKQLGYDVECECGKDNCDCHIFKVIGSNWVGYSQTMSHNIFEKVIFYPVIDGMEVHGEAIAAEIETEDFDGLDGVYIVANTRVWFCKPDVIDGLVAHKLEKMACERVMRVRQVRNAGRMGHNYSDVRTMVLA